MAPYLRKSLEEDDIDRYNYTWAVSWFFLLTLISLLLPLSPALKGHVQVSDTPSGKLPRAEASCWCPAQFEESQMDYANKYCSSKATGILQGTLNEQDLYYSYYFQAHAFHLRHYNSRSLIEARALEMMNEYKAEKEQKQEREKEMKGAILRLNQFIHLKTPLILFVLVLLLKLPQLMRWLLRGSLSGCINVDQALEMCKDYHKSDQKLIHETVLAVSTSLQSSRSKSAIVYLFMKVIVLLVTIGQAVFISHYVLVDIQSANADLKTVEGHNASDNNTVLDAPFEYPNNIYHCFFKIRQLKNVHDYTVQCEMEVIKDELPNAEVTSTISKVKFLYQAMFTIVLATLILLIVVNIISALSWVVKLTATTTTALGLPRHVPLDMTFLVHMARINVSPSVSMALAAEVKWQQSKGDNEMNELTE